MSFSDWLFDPSGLTPHGFCLSWLPGLIFLHAGSDAVIGLAYLSIPIALISFARQRTDLAYGWIAYLFVAFILACGATHLLSILTLWVPAYGVEGIVKGITAVLSLATATLLWPLIPRLVAVPTSEQLLKLNSQLASSVGAHQSALVLLQESDVRLRTLNKGLEARVLERTHDLETANQSLSQTMQTLAQTEAEYRASFEGAAVGKMLAEPLTRRIVRVNRALADMLGCEPHELVGGNAAELTVRDDQAEDALEYGRLLNNEIDVLVRGQFKKAAPYA
jgi:PAS domain-containing protein